MLRFPLPYEPPTSTNRPGAVPISSPGRRRRTGADAEQELVADGANDQVQVAVAAGDGQQRGLVFGFVVVEDDVGRIPEPCGLSEAQGGVDPWLQVAQTEGLLHKPECFLHGPEADDDHIVDWIAGMTAIGDVSRVHR